MASAHAGTAHRGNEVALLRRIVEHLPHGVWAIDRLGGTLLVNESLARMLGRSCEEISLSGPLSYIHPGDEDVGRLLFAPDSPQKEMTVPLRWSHADDAVIWTEITSTPLMGDNGEWCGVLTVCREILPGQRTDPSHSQLSAIVESSDDAIIGKSLDGTITSWNKAATRVFGYTADEAIGKPIRMLIPKDRQHEEDAIIARLKRGERIDHFRTVRLAKGGKSIQLSITISPIRDSSGKVVGASKIARDITERQQAEADRAHLAAIVDSSDDAIISKTLDGIIQSWNAGAERLFGYTAAEAIGQPITMLHPPDRLDEEGLIMSRLRRGQRVDHLETVRVSKDGKMIDVWETISPVRDQSGVVVAASKVVRDISDRKQIERERSQLNLELERRVEERTAELEAANREMEGFTYSVSHDLRAPLRAISATSSLLLDEYGANLPPNAQELLERQRAAALKLARLIDDLLTFSRLGRQEVERSDTDLSEIVSEIAADLQRAGKAERIAFEIQPFVSANVDRTLLRFVLMNLIDNACKFSPKGGIVRFGSNVGKQGTVYYVSDEGVGFDMTYIDKLFVPFERLVREEEFPGTGIGLANVQRIIERHGGHVWATAAPGKGATFYFTVG